MAVKKLQAHHRAWLSAHPDRSEDWLRDMFSEGFDIHHVDGDHHNNTPLNLVLIEAVDHMRLHGFKLPHGLVGWRKNLQRKSTEAKRKKKAAESLSASAIQPDGGCNPQTFVTAKSGLDEMSVRAYLSRIQ